MTAHGDSLLAVRDLVTELRTPQGVVRAVDGVSWTVLRGETVAIVGESGCGKSMMARSVMRVLPTPIGRISAGSVELSGRDLTGLSEKAMRRIRGAQMSMIFQDPMTHLDPLMTIGSQIGEVIRVHGVARREDLGRQVEDALRAAQISDPERVARSYPHQLSGGLRQRALIALALACNPQLLIADEPTTALDVTTQRQILQLLRQLVTERGMGLVLITHDLGVVASTCDRVYVMYAGQIVEHASVEDFFARPQHPYSQGLLSSVRSIGTRGERLPTVPGHVPSLLAPPAGCRFRDRCPVAMPQCAEEDPVTSLPQASGQHAACWRADQTLGASLV